MAQAGRMSQRCRSKCCAAAAPESADRRLPLVLTEHAPRRDKEESRFRIRYFVCDGNQEEKATGRARNAHERSQENRPRKIQNRKEKGGRPFIGRVARVHISLTVTPETQAALKREARKRNLSIGLLVDDLTAPFRRGRASRQAG